MKVSAPKAPQEDPEVTAARKREQERAEAERIRQLQAQLGQETRATTVGLNSRGLVQVQGGMRRILGAG